MTRFSRFFYFLYASCEACTPGAAVRCPLLLQILIAVGISDRGRCTSPSPLWQQFKSALKAIKNASSDEDAFFMELPGGFEPPTGSC
mgnify:CR=1 FL=1